MTSDTTDNRRPTWMLPEVAVREKMTPKEQNGKTQVKMSSLKLIKIIVH